MEDQKTPEVSAPDMAEEAMAMVIDQTLHAPWVLLEVQRDAGDAMVYGVKLHIGGGIDDLETVAVLLRKVLDTLVPEVPPTPQVTRFFTFGGGQRHPVTGEPLGDRYVEIADESVDHCRAVMLNHFGNEWSFDYATSEEAGVDRFKLRELPQKEWPPSTDKFYVDGMGCSRAR